MTGASADLSRLQLNRDEPPPALRRALARTVLLFVVAAFVIGGAVFALRARAEAKIADIEGKMKTLAAMKRTLRGLVDQCEQCGSAECPILASLESSR